MSRLMRNIGRWLWNVFLATMFLACFAYLLAAVVMSGS